MIMKPAALVHKGMQMVGILQRILIEKRRVRMRARVHPVSFRKPTHIMAGMMILGLNLDKINDPGSWVMM